MSGNLHLKLDVSLQTFHTSVKILTFNSYNYNFFLYSEVLISIIFIICPLAIMFKLITFRALSL